MSNVTSQHHTLPRQTRYADEVPATACVMDIIRMTVLCEEITAVAKFVQVLCLPGMAPPWLRVIRVK